MAINNPEPIPVYYFSSQITINYHETATSSITDLTGTKWLFNSEISIPSSLDSSNFYINFNSNDGSFTRIGFNSTTEPPDYRLKYYPASGTLTIAYASYYSGWSNESYRTISITGGTDVTNSNLITWLQANATQIEDPEPEPEPEPTPSNPNLTDIFTDVADAIRAKTGKSDPLYPVNFANEIATIETGGGGAELNIHYSSTTAPSDTSKLWVKTDTEPAKVTVSKDLSLGTEVISTSSATLPTAIGYMASGVVGTKVYLFGGNNAGSYSNKIYRFDTTTETITTLSTTLPTVAYYMASGVVGTKIYLFGGSISGGYSNQIYCFDTTTETITTLSTTLPYKRYAMASGVVGTKIYLFGGHSGSSFSNQIYCFDTTTETITTLGTTLPKSIMCMTSGVVGTKIYLFGGTTGDYLNTIYCFNAITETISKLSATLTSSTIDMGSGVIGSKIYLFGGRSYTNRISCFDSTTETISNLSVTLPVAIGDIASGVVGTKVYLFGGYNGSTSSRIIYRFTVSFALAENNLLLLDTGSNSFNLVNTSALVIESKPKQVYIGDSNDSGEYVESALYANGSWQPIG